MAFPISHTSNTKQGFADRTAFPITS